MWDVNCSPKGVGFTGAAVATELACVAICARNGLPCDLVEPACDDVIADAVAPGLPCNLVEPACDDVIADAVAPGLPCDLVEPACDDVIADAVAPGLPCDLVEPECDDVIADAVAPGLPCERFGARGWSFDDASRKGLSPELALELSPEIFRARRTDTAAALACCLRRPGNEKALKLSRETKRQREWPSHTSRPEGSWCARLSGSAWSSGSDWPSLQKRVHTQEWVRYGIENSLEWASSKSTVCPSANRDKPRPFPLYRHCM